MSNEHSETTTIVVDNEEYAVPKHDLTAEDIVRLVGKDPSKVYLVQVEGRNQVSYKDAPTDKPNVHNKAKFVTATSADTQVSER